MQSLAESASRRKLAGAFGTVLRIRASTSIVFGTLSAVSGIATFLFERCKALVAHRFTSLINVIEIKSSPSNSCCTRNCVLGRNFEHPNALVRRLTNRFEIPLCDYSCKPHNETSLRNEVRHHETETENLSQSKLHGNRLCAGSRTQPKRRRLAVCCFSQRYAGANVLNEHFQVPRVAKRVAATAADRRLVAWLPQCEKNKLPTVEVLRSQRVAQAVSTTFSINFATPLRL